VVSIHAMLRDDTAPVAALAGPAGRRCVIAGSHQALERRVSERRL
jgi:hypothetical protein